MSYVAGIDDLTMTLYILVILLGFFGGRDAILNIKLFLLKNRGYVKDIMILNNKQLVVSAVQIKEEQIDHPMSKEMKYGAKPSSLFLQGKTPVFLHRQGEFDPLNPLEKEYKFDAKRIQQVIKMARLSGKLDFFNEIAKSLKLLTLLTLIFGGGSLIMLVLIANSMGL